MRCIFSLPLFTVEMCMCAWMRNVDGLWSIKWIHSYSRLAGVFFFVSCQFHGLWMNSCTFHLLCRQERKILLRISIVMDISFVALHSYHSMVNDKFKCSLTADTTPEYKILRRGQEFRSIVLMTCAYSNRSKLCAQHNFDWKKITFNKWIFWFCCDAWQHVYAKIHNPMILWLSARPLATDSI